MMELVALDKAVSTLQLRGLRKQFFRGQVYVGSSMVGFILSLSFIKIMSSCFAIPLWEAPLNRFCLLVPPRLLDKLNK